jgi:hypothetical protein
VNYALLARPDLTRPVTDNGGRDLPVRRASGQVEESGHGLQLVDALAAQWGYARNDAGATITWFEITP